MVPILNARFALNAANARWGSLYDALYGTDVISEDDGAEKGTSYNRVRGDKVIAYARNFLDKAVPLASGRVERCDRHQDRRRLARRHVEQRMSRRNWPRPSSSSATPASSAPRRGRCCCSTTACTSRSSSTPTLPVGATDPAGIKDVVLESAITTIQDFEDSVAAVDADDKVLGYRNWLGLNRGDLTEEVAKDGKSFTRVLNEDRTYTDTRRRR